MISGEAHKHSSVPTEPIASFIQDDFHASRTDELPLPMLFQSHIIPLMGKKSPRILVNIQGFNVPMLLDSGAEVSVLPRTLMDKLVTPRVSDSTHSGHTVQSFGGTELMLAGPRCLQIQVCGVNLIHPFYSLDADTPLVAGYDLILAAKLVIDPVRQCAWSHFNSNTLTQLPTAAVNSPTTQDHSRSQNSCVLQSTGHTGSDTPIHPGSASQCLDPKPVVLAHNSAVAIDTLLDTDLPTSSDIQNLPDHVRLLYSTTVHDSNLTPDIATGLRELLCKHANTFAANSNDLGYCDIVMHDIDTGDARPIKQSPCRPPLAARDEEDKILNDMLATNVVEPSTSAWASPVCLVKKKDQSYRFCVDYRKLNSVSKRDAFPVPNITDALDNLQGHKLFASCDILSGYWQIGMSDRAKERSAFCTKRGLYQFTRMPFGLTNAPSTFCRLMSIVLADLLWVICLNYIDDIIIFARTEQELLERLDIVFTRLQDVGLKLKPSKCVLFKTEIEFLGHVISEKGVRPMPQKLQVIKDWPTPHCIRDVRAFVGLCSYYRRYIKGFASLAEPLTSLSKKGTQFQSSEQAETAFANLKKALMAASTLAFPHPDIPCIVDSDASDVQAGGVLSQVIDGEERPIAFFSRVLNGAQRNYCPTRRELLAVVMTLQHFRHYLLGSKIILRTDHHSLKWLNGFKRPEGILARWLETLAEFDYTIEHRAGRLHCNADGVSRTVCKQCVGKQVKTPWIDELERSDELTEPLSVNALTFEPEISNDQMATLQSQDPTLSPVIECLVNSHNPSFDELKALPLDSRNLLSQRPMIQLCNGVLVRMNDQVKQLVVPATLRRRLFDHTHAGPLSAHLGSERTLLQLKQGYYWPSMRKDVNLWYRLCVDCTTSKGPLSHYQGPLQKVLTGAPLDIVAVDILSGLPTASDGSKHILVLTDNFSKWSEAYGLPDAEAHTCMMAMYNNFFSRFGLPRQLHSDGAANFEGKLFHELCKITEVNKTRTTPFHPRSDGQTERMNRTILQMLRTSAHDNPTDWPSRLPAILAAYRMTVHSTTTVTPNFAMLGREVLLPCHLIARPPEEPNSITVPFVQNFQENLRDAHHKIRMATQNAAKTQKTFFDKQIKGPPFSVNQLVWLYWPKPIIQQKFKKLQRLWTGPYKIIKFQSSVVVIIEHTETRKRQTVHIDRLTPCSSTVLLPSQNTDTQLGTQTVSASQPESEHEHDTQHDTASQEFDSDNTATPLPDTVHANTAHHNVHRTRRSRRRPRYLVDYV